MKDKAKKVFRISVAALLLALLLPDEIVFAQAVLRTVSVGRFPVSLGITPDGEKLYVTNAGDNTVSVIETQRRRRREGRGDGEEILSTINVGNFPTRVAVSPNGQRVWVANGTSNTVTVINANTDQVLATVPVGQFPLGIAVNPNGLEVYTADSTSNIMTIINTSTLSAVASVNVGSFPASVVVSPDGLRAYVANGDSNSVSVIDLGLRVVQANINVGTFPLDLALNPSGSRLYVVNAESHTVSIIDTANNTVIGFINSGAFPTGVQVKPDGSHLYVANTDSDTATIFNTTTNALLKKLLVGDFPLGITFKPNSDFAYTVNSGSDSITVINPDSDDESDTLFVAHTNTIVGDDVVWGVLDQPNRHVQIIGSENRGNLQSDRERRRRGERNDLGRDDVFTIARGQIGQFGTFIYFIDFNPLIRGRFFFQAVLSDDFDQTQNVTLTNIAELDLRGEDEED